jgi:phenylalanyl-tRNA synthetase beta chain
MKISYNWLKQYLNIDKDPEEISKILTNTGLEVEALEEYSSVKGGLKGCIIGEVKTKIKHPDADKLNLTIVDIGNEELLHIVCGAPNVEAGQKVIVATIGTTLYTTKGELELKKTKIRGEISEGMICAEDELGLGESHAGIMVLDPSVKVGTPASEYFNIENDWVFEIGLTPNRADAMSHIGVARDLAAALTCIENKEYNITKPDLSNFKVENNSRKIDIIVEDTIACPRYAGITVSGIHVGDSPEWLQNKLKAVGLRPINNIVDITNFVLMETGQPLHAFAANHISGNKVIVKKLAKGTKFITLDEADRELQAEDLMICNEKEGMCIAGVFGGAKSGVTVQTQDVFIESAYFDPVHVRKTSKYHGLKTDASFRFERGVDPNMILFALKRAALLMKEIAGGTISSEIIDVYPTAIENFNVTIQYNNVDKLIGKRIDREVIKRILNSLEITILSETNEGLVLSVPPFKVDVKREADVTEEILRIYGYNNVEEPQQFRISPSKAPKPDNEKTHSTIADYLSSCGFYEIMNNSLTNASYVEKLKSFHVEENVQILNPLSNELAVMRQTLLFGGLESVAYNINRKNPDLKLYEFGKIYRFNKNAESQNSLSNYYEEEQLALFTCGNIVSENWYNGKGNPVSFYFLKAFVNDIFKRIGINLSTSTFKEISNDIFSEGLEISINKSTVATFGRLAKSLLKTFDIKPDVFYAVLEWEKLIKLSGKNIVTFSDIPKFPEVRRDLALLLDKKIKFSDVEELAYKTVPTLLKNVNLFDVYAGEKIGEDKKSYAVSYTLLDESKTLTDAEIELIMNKLINAYKEKLSAVIR